MEVFNFTPTLNSQRVNGAAPRLAVAAETTGQTINGGQGDGGEWESVVMESLSSPLAPGVTMATTFQGKPPSV